METAANVVDLASRLVKALKGLAIQYLNEDRFADHRRAIDLLERSRAVAADAEALRASRAGGATSADEPREDIESGSDTDVEETRYFTRGDELVKHGPKRGGGGIYEQRVPSSNVAEVLARLNELRGEKAEFSADEVYKRLPRPQYWTYLVLGALVETGLVSIPRRGTYRFEKPGSTITLPALWEALDRLSQQEGGDT